MTSKKDYIFNIRLSRTTYEKLKNKALENRETMSNLARKVLDDGLEILDEISDDVFGTKDIKNQDIVVYYDGELFVESTCFECGKKIKPKQKIKIGETRDGQKHYFCMSCFRSKK